MSVIRVVNIKITGQVPDDCNDNDYKMVLAELKLICAKYDLELEERC